MQAGATGVELVHIAKAMLVAGAKTQAPRAGKQGVHPDGGSAHNLHSSQCVYPGCSGITCAPCRRSVVVLARGVLQHIG